MSLRFAALSALSALLCVSCINSGQRSPQRAAAQQPSPASVGASAVAPSPTQATQPAVNTSAHAPFVVHEWGTFTSVQDHEGRTLDRMYEEDEPLPPFVHRLAPGFADRPTKGFARTDETFALLSKVTQRLETPVLYFYGAPKDDVEIKVDFPKGIISEWFPGASSYKTPTTLTDHQMTWRVELSERAPKLLPVEPQSVWSPSRQVNALTVTDKLTKQEEPFIFYRGVGGFELPIKVRTAQDGQLTVFNEGDAALSHVFVFKTDGQRGKLYSLGEVKPGQRVTHGPTLASPSPKESPAFNHINDAKAQLERALVASGLNVDEAKAMLNTWERSYFHTPGVRILYVVPRQWTDQLLPIAIKPQPDKLERVLIGRIEALRPEALEKTATALKGLYEAKREPAPDQLGPFLLPRLQAIHDAQPEGEYKVWLAQLIRHHHDTMTPFRAEVDR